MKKIVITGDILRPNDNMQTIATTDIKWIYDLFSNQIKRACNIETQLVLWDNETFDAKEFFKKNNSKFNCVLDWANLYNCDTITKEAQQYLCSKFEDSIVIGYELSNMMMKIFDLNNITYINLTLHPVRYLSDVFFMFCTNNKEIFYALKKYTINDDMFYSEAGYIKGMLSKKRNLNFPSNSALIIGQTDVDASIITDDNKLLSLKDYENELKKVVKSHSKVYFKPHPYAQNKQEMMDFAQNIGIESINDNIYVMLSQQGLKDIYAISSSCVTEAQYFNVNGHYLYKSAFNISQNIQDDDFNPLKFIPVFEKYYSTSFWCNILKPVTDINNNITKEDYITYKNKLRTALNMFWGYDFESINNISNTNTHHSSFLSKLFSIKNSSDKSHKIVTILT